MSCLESNTKSLRGWLSSGATTSRHDSDHLVCLGSFSPPHLPLPLRFTAAKVPEELHGVLISPKELDPAPLFSQ